MTALVLILMLFAVHRMTHFITRDNFPPMLAFRKFVLRSLGKDHWLSYLVKCMWCVSIYVSAGVVTFVWQVSGAPVGLEGWPAAILLWLSLSTLTGYLGQVDTVLHNLGEKLRLEKEQLERVQRMNKNLDSRAQGMSLPEGAYPKDAGIGVFGGPVANQERVSFP